MMYGYVKRKVIWYKTSDNPVDLSAYVLPITTKKNFKPENNSCSINLIDNDLVYSNGVFQPKENDLFIIYAKIVYNTSQKDFTNDDIIWTGRFVDYDRSHTPDGVTLKFTIADFGYDVFNRFSKKTYLSANKKTDEVIVDIVKETVENEFGLGTYKLNFDNVATTRNDNSPFPIAAYSNIMKPNHEIINELSQVNWTNSEAEITAGTQVITQPMIFDIRGSNVYWFEQPETLALTVTSNSWINSISQKTNNESTTNYLILECGEDLTGEPIFTYVIDESSESLTIKEGFQYQIKIAGRNETYDNQYHNLRLQYVGNNSGFKNAVIRLAQSFADTWFKMVGKGKRTIKLTLPKTGIELGQTVSINLPRFDNKLYRVIEVGHDIGRSWETNIELEEIIE